MGTPLQVRISEISKRQQEMCDTLRDIKFALTGEQKLGIEGIVYKINKHEKVINQYKSDRAKVLGASATAGTIFGAIGAWLSKYL